MAGSLLDLWACVFAEYPGRLEDGRVLHYMAEPSESARVRPIVDVENTMVDLILEIT